MTKLNVSRNLAGAATVAAITIAAPECASPGAESAAALGTKTPTKTEKVVRIDRDRSRVRFSRFGYFDVVAAPAPACFYKWTGRAGCASARISVIDQPPVPVM